MYLCERKATSCSFFDRAYNNSLRKKNVFYKGANVDFTSMCFSMKVKNRHIVSIE